MQPDQAKFLQTIYLAQIGNETKTTQKVLAAIPDQNHDYRPDPKSKSAMELGWHIASAAVYFLEGAANREFGQGGQPIPPEIKTGADLAAWYGEHVGASLAKVSALSGEQLATPVNFHNMLNQPAVAYLGLHTVHEVHHRGQLSTYLRAMGGKVPGIYGGSADEPVQMPAKA